jgi:hypothetical protein
MKSDVSSFARLGLFAFFALTFSSSPVHAQTGMSPEDEAIYKNMIKATGMDPNAIMAAKKSVDSSRSWTDAKDGIIHYHIVGNFKGQANVSGDSNWMAYADVTDSVTIDLDWNLPDSTLVGSPTFKNTKSVVTNPRNPEPSCSAPIIKGDYEHYDLQSIKDGMAGSLEVQVKTNYPVVEVAQFCTGSRKSVPATSKTHSEEMSVLSPVLFTMQVPDSDSMRVSPDKKSLIHKDAGWTWTFTPSIDK